MIPQRNISLISNTLVTAGERRIPESVIERDYVLAWFLTGKVGIAAARRCRSGACNRRQGRSSSAALGRSSRAPDEPSSAVR